VTQHLKQVLALYHFVHPHMSAARLGELREQLLAHCANQSILGTLLLAGEGIR